MNIEQKISALTITQLVIIAAILAAVILAYIYRSQIKSLLTSE